MANEKRGEVEFAGGDIKFTARPTFALIQAIEQETRMSILLLSAKVRAASLTFTETVMVVALAAQNSPNPPAGADKPDFRERIFEVGPLDWMKPVAQLLGAAISTGAPSKKGDGEGAKKPKASPGSDT